MSCATSIVVIGFAVLGAMAGVCAEPIGCVQLAPGLSDEEQAVLSGGIQRLRQAAGYPLDMLHGTGQEPSTMERYALVVRMMLERSASAPADAYEVRSAAQAPSVVELHASSVRGLLYACHDLAGRIEAGEALAGLECVRTPLVPHRLALLCPSTRFGKHFQPGLFWRSIEEMARLGMNGVLIVPAKTHGVPAGMTSLPLRLGAEGVEAVEPELGEWRAVLQRVKTSGQDVFMLCSPFIPPQYTMAQVRDHYDGSATLVGFDDAAEQALGVFLSGLFDRLPEMDGVVLHSLELGEMWEDAVSMFPCKDLQAGSSAFNAYLTALDSVCSERGKVACFWSHVGGIDGTTMVDIREELARHPGVVNLEDAYWPNAGWPMLPLLGYLPDRVRKDIHVRGRFGMFLEPTDGEYYGGGVLPAVYPTPHYEASREAVRRGAEVAVLRLNEHDETGLGTLFSPPAVLFEMAASQLWSPARSPDRVWRDVCTRLYGEKASSTVEKALRHGKSILLDGFTLSGFPLLDHEGVNPGHWLPGRMAFRLFGTVGTPVVAGPPDALRGEAFTAWQSRSKAVEMEEFHMRNSRARAAAEAGLASILSAESLLARDDYTRLRDSFSDAIIVIDTLRALGEAANALNAAIVDSTSAGNGGARLREALRKLAERADWLEANKGPDFLRVHDFVVVRSRGTTYAGPALAESLRVIHDSYEDAVGRDK